MTAPALETLEDFDHATYRCRYCFGISPQFERARAAREPKPVRPPTVQPAELPACAPAKGPLPEVVDYDSLVRCLRARADELQICREAISAIAKLPSGYAADVPETSNAAKILSLSKVRRIGMESLGPILGALGMKLVAIPDEAAMARNAAEYGARDQAHLKSAMARWEAPDSRPTRRSARSHK